MTDGLALPIDSPEAVGLGAGRRDHCRASFRELVCAAIGD